MCIINTELKDYRNHKSAKYELARTVEAWIDRISTFAIGQTLTSTGLWGRSSDPQASRIPIAHSLLLFRSFKAMKIVLCRVIAEC
jgi:hypothetical protein